MNIPASPLHLINVKVLLNPVSVGFSPCPRGAYHVICQLFLFGLLRFQFGQGQAFPLLQFLNGILVFYQGNLSLWGKKEKELILIVLTL